MTSAECWQLVEGTHLARLAVSVSGEPDIFPITVFGAEGTLTFRTVPGTKLASLVTNHRVAVEWDGCDQHYAWSIVVHAQAQRRAPHHADETIERAARKIRPIIDFPAEDWVVLTPITVTGRRFRRANPSA